MENSKSFLVRTAAHEVGHALVAMDSPAVSDVEEVNILQASNQSRGFAGVTLIRYRRDHPQYLWESLIVYLAGAAGEITYMGNMKSVGCKADLLEALSLARRIIAISPPTLNRTNFNFDVGQCFKTSLTIQERYILNLAYKAARQRILKKEEVFKTLIIKLMNAGRLNSNELV